MRMMRAVVFIVIEALVFVAAECANALAIAPIPRSSRLAAGLVIALFFALGFLVPRTTRGRVAALILDGLLLGAMAAFSGTAVTVAALLPLRCLRLQPYNRAALLFCTAFGLVAFVWSAIVGIYMERRPVELLGAALLFRSTQ
jgi:hypothetical protein